MCSVCVSQVWQLTTTSKCGSKDRCARAARLGSAAAAAVAAAAADVPLAIRWLMWQWTAGAGPTRASGGVAEDKLKLHRRASQLASAP